MTASPISNFLLSPCLDTRFRLAQSSKNLLRMRPLQSFWKRKPTQKWPVVTSRGFAELIFSQILREGYDPWFLLESLKMLVPETVWTRQHIHEHWSNLVVYDQVQTVYLRINSVLPVKARIVKRAPNRNINS